MKVLFRVDASASMGIGHLMRCQALAQALAQQQIDSVFALRQDALAIARDRHDWTGQLNIIPDNVSQADELGWMQHHLLLNEMDFVVLDGYQFNSDYRASLKAVANKLVLFDDNNNSGLLHADLVINAAANASQLNYIQTAPEAIHCLGSEYTILRQEFYHQPPVEWQQRHSLCVMLGGSDPLNLTLPILAALQQRNVDIPIRVITGAAYPYLQELQLFIRQSTQAIQHVHNCQQMAEIMSHSRLMLSAAGGSQFELLSCQTPALLVIVAENQRNATRQAEQQGWCKVLDQLDQGNVELLIDELLVLWNNDAGLKVMHQQASQYTGINGVEKVLDNIEQMLKTGS